MTTPTAAERRMRADYQRQADLAAAGKRHTFAPSQKDLGGGPCRHCGAKLMEGKHR